MVKQILYASATECPGEAPWTTMSLGDAGCVLSKSGRVKRYAQGGNSECRVAGMKTGDAYIVGEFKASMVFLTPPHKVRGYAASLSPRTGGVEKTVENNELNAGAPECRMVTRAARSERSEVFWQTSEVILYSTGKIEIGLNLGIEVLYPVLRWNKHYPKKIWNRRKDV